MASIHPVSPVYSSINAAASLALDHCVQKIVQQTLIESLYEVKLEYSMGKMLKNASKAIKEHRDQAAQLPYESCLASYVQIQEIIPIDPKNQCLRSPLNLECHAFEARGRRKTMEDARFFEETPWGSIFGILDGHHGSAVADLASTHFKQIFVETYAQCLGDVREAFIEAFNRLQEECTQDNRLSEIGSTAVISFIDAKTNIIYTATLGDSEMMICRTIRGTRKLIPCSCVRNWGCQHDAERAAEAKKDPSIVKQWTEVKNPKILRFPYAHAGLNVSRALGDTAFKPAVSHKPKITAFQLEPDDTVFMACDGLFDFVAPEEIIFFIDECSPEEVAKQLVNFAIKVKHSNDNVTVMTVNAKA